MSGRGRRDDDLVADLEAALASRRELGRDYEQALVESFVDRVDGEISARVRAEIDERDRRATGDDLSPPMRFATAVASLVFGVPVTIVPITVAMTNDGSEALAAGATLVSWVGIVGINAAVNRWPRRRR